MAMDQWNIEPASRRCVVSGAELAEGEEYYAVLFEQGDTFRREEYSVGAWTGPPDGAFCHFRTRVPVRARKARLLVDDDMLIHFFARLAGAEEEAKQRFRFVLALILMRKRLLKFEETVRKDDREWWRMRLTRDASDGSASKDEPQMVLNPRLDEQQIESVSRELGVILHGYVDSGDEGPVASEAAEGE
jgi:hypothetical protein